MVTQSRTRRQFAIIVAMVCLSSACLDAGTFKSDVRLAMREAEAISKAVTKYALSQNQYPPALGDLVPDYLEYLPNSPWGTAFALSVNGLVFHISLQLPRAVCLTSELLIGAGGWEVYPRCVLTDEEKRELTYRELSALANACEAYRVDNNEYPTNTNQLLGIYIKFVPDQDPYKRSYNHSLSTSGYTLSSYGRDHQPGGQFWDADTVLAQGQLTARIATHSDFEYAVDATLKFRVLKMVLDNYHASLGTFPDSLSQLFPTYISTPDFEMDLYSQPVYYNRLTADTYELGALGKDGVPGTDDYEVRLAGTVNSVTPIFTPDLAILYRDSQKTSIFDGGLLVQLP